MSEDMKGLKDSLRAALLAAKTPKSVLVDLGGGLEAEVREPTRARASKILQVSSDYFARNMKSIMGKKGDKDTASIVANPFYMMAFQEVQNKIAALYMSYVPGTDEPVFQLHDLDVIDGLPTSSAFDLLADAAGKLLIPSTEDAEKNSEATPSDKSSS